MDNLILPVRRNYSNAIRLTAFAIFVTGCFAASSVAATKIDFSLEDDLVTPLVNGQKIDDGEEFGILVNILHAGPNSGAAIFDSTPGLNLADPDLWVGLGNILILQENAGTAGALTGDIFNTPNDDPSSNNYLFFNFLSNVRVESIDLVDIDQNGPANVTLTDSMGRTRVYTVPKGWTFEADDPNLPPGGQGYDTLDLTTLANQTGEGGSTATAAETQGFDQEAVVQLKVEFDGSGGLDNLVFVPEPASALLIALAAPLLLRRRRR